MRRSFNESFLGPQKLTDGICFFGCSNNIIKIIRILILIIYDINALRKKSMAALNRPQQNDISRRIKVQ